MPKRQSSLVTFLFMLAPTPANASPLPPPKKKQWFAPKFRLWFVPRNRISFLLQSLAYGSPPPLFKTVIYLGTTAHYGIRDMMFTLHF